MPGPTVETLQKQSYSERPVIMIDPGHGGSDHGCEYGDITESQYCFVIANVLRDSIRNLGWPCLVVLSREGDLDMSLLARGHASQTVGAGLVLSLHVNAGVKELSGLMTFCLPASGRSRQVADVISRSAPAELDRRRLSILATDTLGPDDDWLRRARNVLLPHSPHADVVLVELGFASNDNDRAELLSPIVQRQLVASLLCGVARWLPV